MPTLLQNEKSILKNLMLSGLLIKYKYYLKVIIIVTWMLHGSDFNIKKKKLTGYSDEKVFY